MLCYHLQAVLFVDEETVSKGMMKYASAIPRESVVDITSEVAVPEEPIEGFTCSHVPPLASFPNDPCFMTSVQQLKACLAYALTMSVFLQISEQILPV